MQREITDWYEISEKEKHKRFSVNGVPYPLDDYLSLKNEQTTNELAKKIMRWE